LYASLRMFTLLDLVVVVVVVLVVVAGGREQ
jgi:hypothetical protein